jgi:hypothetical protein
MRGDTSRDFPDPARPTPEPSPAPTPTTADSAKDFPPDDVQTKAEPQAEDAAEEPTTDTAKNFPPADDEKPKHDADGATPPGDDRKTSAAKDAGDTPQLSPEDIDARKKRLRDLIAKAADAADPNAASAVQTLLRQIPRDANGNPLVDLDELEKKSNDILAKQGVPLPELLQQTGDFLAGVGRDVRDLGAAAIDAGKSAGHTLKELATNPEAQDRFWDGVVSTTDKTKEAVAKGAHDFVDWAKQAGRDLSDTEMLKAFGSHVASETKDLARDLTDTSILADTASHSVSDLGDPDKIADAAKRGIPGGEDLAKAMDPSKPVTERLAHGLKGASDWAFTADGANSGIEMVEKAGSKVMGAAGRAADRLLGDAAEGAATREMTEAAGSQAAKVGESGAAKAVEDAGPAGAQASEKAESAASRAEQRATNDMETPEGRARKDCDRSFDDARREAFDAQTDLRATEAEHEAAKDFAERADQRAKELRAKADSLGADHPDYPQADRLATATEKRAAEAGADVDKAKSKLDAAQDTFDQKREDWLNNDPRRAFRRATEAETRAEGYVAAAKQDAEKASEELENARKAAAESPGDAEAQARHAKATEDATAAQERLDRERQAHAKAQAVKDDAEDQLIQHRENEADFKKKIDDDISQHFGIDDKDKAGQMRVVRDRTSMEEAREAQHRQDWLASTKAKEDQVVYRVRDPKGQMVGNDPLEFAVDPKRVETIKDPLTGEERHVYRARDGSVMDATKEVVDKKEPNIPAISKESEGFTSYPNRSSTVLPDMHSAIHERSHALTSPEWRGGTSDGLIEGMNEHLTQKYAEAKKIPIPQGHYYEERLVADELDKATRAINPATGKLEEVNRKLADAVYNGKMDEFHQAIGEKLGHTDPTAAQAAGKAYRQQISDLMKEPDGTLEALKLAKKLNGAP